jgi:predicted DNA-binding transcriptional regulator AlpA
MNQKRKLILQTLEFDSGITAAQKAAIETILNDKTPSVEPLLLKQTEVAQLMGLSRQAVYNLKKLGIIQPIKITLEGCERYKREDIINLINNGIPQRNRGNP